MIDVGTSNRVYPAAALIYSALRSNAAVIEINPAPTAVSNAVDCRFAAPASHVLPAIINALDEALANG